MDTKPKRGRPTDATKTAKIYVRVTEEEHDKFLALGGSKWLRKQLREAK